MRNLFGFVAVIIGILWLGGGSLLPSAQAWPLTAPQRERLEKYIPRTFAKLDAQQGVHIVSLGDSVTMMFTPDKDNGNSLLSYQARFADLLAREFFYPGGVRVLNPPKGLPEKLEENQGQEIFLENLADGGTTGLDVFQQLAAKAFLHNPDLMIINYGINDAARGQGLETFRRSLQIVADACKQQKTDLIIMGCSMAQISPGPTGWGLTRTFTTVAREVAEENGVLFVDLGRIIAQTGGGAPPRTDPEAAINLLAEHLTGIFDFDPPPKPAEKLHPNPTAHRKMGTAFFSELIDGPPPPVYSMNALGAFTSEDTVEVSLSLRNQSKEQRRGYVGALAMGRFLYPESPNFAFDLKPGENQQIKLIYKRFERDAFGEPGDDGPRFFPSDIADPYLRLSYFVVDEEQSDLIDVVTRLQPLGVSWTQRRFNEVTDKIRIEWQFVNGTDQPLRGKYRIGLGKAISGSEEFTLPPLGVNDFEALFPFAPPPGIVRIKYPLFLEIEANGVKYTFHRELEAARDIGLGERIALTSTDDYDQGEKSGPQDLKPDTSGIVMRVDADASALYFTFDFQKIDFIARPNAYPMVADLLIDARESQRVRGFGFAHKLRIESGVDDGSSFVKRPQFGTFGETYNMVLSEDGFSSNLKTLGDGSSRRLEVRIPRQYLYRHEWGLGDPNSVLGLNAIITMSAVLPDVGMAHHPAQQGYVMTRPTRGVGSTMYQFDPRSFATLRLVGGPLTTWSAWIY